MFQKLNGVNNFKTNRFGYNCFGFGHNNIINNNLKLRKICRTFFIVIRFEILPN